MSDRPLDSPIQWILLRALWLLKPLTGKSRLLTASALPRYVRRTSRRAVGTPTSKSGQMSVRTWK
jgi:hypothetical protein